MLVAFFVAQSNRLRFSNNLRAKTSYTVIPPCPKAAFLRRSAVVEYCIVMQKPTRPFTSEKDASRMFLKAGTSAGWILHCLKICDEPILSKAAICDCGWKPQPENQVFSIPLQPSEPPAAECQSVLNPSNPSASTLWQVEQFTNVAKS